MQQGEGDAGTAPPGKLLARIAANAERLRALGILPENDPPPFDIIGDVHGCAAELLTLLSRIGPSDANVLITGEHGTGKEVVALTLHALSPRALRPMITVNTGGLPEGTFESE